MHSSGVNLHPFPPCKASQLLIHFIIYLASLENRHRINCIVDRKWLQQRLPANASKVIVCKIDPLDGVIGFKHFRYRLDTSISNPVAFYIHCFESAIGLQCFCQHLHPLVSQVVLIQRDVYETTIGRESWGNLVSANYSEVALGETEAIDGPIHLANLYHRLDPKSLFQDAPLGWRSWGLSALPPPP